MTETASGARAPGSASSGAGVNADVDGVTHRLPGLVLTDRVFSVPLDHARPDGERIEVFGRIAAAPGGEKRPWLVYLQGGPGYPSPRPHGPGGPDGLGGWLGRAVRDFRVLLLDQRGTGRSTPANRRTLPQRGGPQQQAEYLTHFRADSIVRDCELIRAELAGGEPWTALGQSFGGFCTVTYLSIAPEGLSRALLCGGLPSLHADAEGVYEVAYPRMQRKNEAFYARYPQDVQVAKDVAAYLRTHVTTLPNDALLTVEAFQALGIVLGRGTGDEVLHYALEEPFTRVGGETVLSDVFLEGVQSLLSYAVMPLYAVLHEACYAQDGRATNWSAERVRSRFPQFDADAALADSARPLLFTGETIHPWLFETDPALRPLRETANAVAALTGWTPLYDPEVLAANKVPAAAVIYHDDLYVDPVHSVETAAAIKGLRPWITNEYEHDGLVESGGAVLDRLLGMANGTR